MRGRSRQAFVFYVGAIFLVVLVIAYGITDAAVRIAIPMPNPAARPTSTLPALTQSTDTPNATRPTCVDSTEPNDTPEQAYAFVNLSQELNLTFDHPGDQDWFTFPVDPAYTYTIVARASASATVDLQWQLYGEDMVTPLVNEPVQPGSQVDTAAWHPDRASPVYLRVRNLRETGGCSSDYAYTLRIVQQAPTASALTHPLTIPTPNRASGTPTGTPAATRNGTPVPAPTASPVRDGRVLADKNGLTFFWLRGEQLLRQEHVRREDWSEPTVVANLPANESILSIVGPSTDPLLVVSTPNGPRILDLGKARRCPQGCALDSAVRAIGDRAGDRWPVIGVGANLEFGYGQWNDSPGKTALFTVTLLSTPTACPSPTSESCPRNSFGVIGMPIVTNGLVVTVVQRDPNTAGEELLINLNDPNGAEVGQISIARGVIAAPQVRYDAQLDTLSVAWLAKENDGWHVFYRAVADVAKGLDGASLGSTVSVSPETVVDPQAGLGLAADPQSGSPTLVFVDTTNVLHGLSYGDGKWTTRQPTPYGPVANAPFRILSVGLTIDHELNVLLGGSSHDVALYQSS